MSKEREALGKQDVPAGEGAASTDVPPQPTAAHPGHTYDSVTPGELPAPVVNPAYPSGIHPGIVTQKKSVVDAYLLWLIFGLVGGHHFYLKRPYFGVIYLLTGGLFGCGYLIDMFRLPYLVWLANRQLHDPEEREKKNISDAYTLWFPFGLLGFHHFYLRNNAQGAIYFLTGGVFGIGWLVDLVRIPYMVKATNERTDAQHLEKHVGTAYLLSVSPLGLLGWQHFYLRRPLWGLLYHFSFGLFGIGWLVDWFRVPLLVRRANKQIVLGPNQEKYLDDAYLAWFPFGLLGLHHFYLNRPVWGVVYFFTFGLCGVGWLVDGCRMACLVKDANTLEQERQQLLIYRAPQTGVITGATQGPALGYSETSRYPHQQPPQYLTYTAPYQAPLPGYGPPGAVYQTQGPAVAPAYLQQAAPGVLPIPAYMEQPPPYSQTGGVPTTCGVSTATDATTCGVSTATDVTTCGVSTDTTTCSVSTDATTCSVSTDATTCSVSTDANTATCGAR